MEPTELLRRLLDERGVEWTDGGFPTTATEWCANGVVWHGLLRDGTIELVAMLTPEQAIAATLGLVSEKDRQLCDEEIIERFAAKLRLVDDGEE